MRIDHVLKAALGEKTGLRFNPVDLEPDAIRAVLINEVAPADPKDDFYGGPGAAYPAAAIPLFRRAGAPVDSVSDLLGLGLYLTNAVKRPKVASAIPLAAIQESLPALARELALFPNVKAILLMGDVAKKAYNLIAKKATGKNAVPAGSTYRLRSQAFYRGNVRVMPSYIMTGKNPLIEKSKIQMAAEDIALMLELIQK